MVIYLCSFFVCFSFFVKYGNSSLVSDRIEVYDLAPVVVEDFDNSMNQMSNSVEMANIENISVANLKYTEVKSEYDSVKALATRNISQEEIDAKYYKIFGEDFESKQIRHCIYFESDAEAREEMEGLYIKVWNKDREGNWYQQSVLLEMHKNLVDTTKAVFDELLALPPEERIPIKTISGYNYRTGMSCHTCGVAIDINWEENAEMTIDGIVTTGSYWKPYEDIYSIPADSKMVEIFAKYGFGWGGFWTNKKDYMHFSYFNR